MNNDSELFTDESIRQEFKEEYLEEIGIEPSDEELTDYIRYSLGYSNVKRKNNVSDSPFHRVLSVIFIIWFVGSIFGSIYFFGVNQYMGFLIFGQFFLVMGLIAVFNKVPIGWIFVLAGLGLIIIPTFIKYSDLLSFKVNWEFFGILTAGIFFTLCGLGMFFIPIINSKKLKKRCSLNIYAKVININKLNCPVYEYNVSGKRYRVAGQKNEKHSLGENVQLNVDPNEPRDIFYEYSFKDNLFLHIFAIPFILSGLFVIYKAFYNL